MIPYFQSVTLRHKYSTMLTIKEINKLALPAILFNITEPIIGLADIAIIGRIDGDATLAQGGVGLAAGLIATLVVVKKIGE